MAFPKKAKFVVIGAGIHGLSTAWHLSEKLKKKNSNGTNNEIVVIEKSGIASGASGVACGVVRNIYFQPAMRELMMHSVKVCLLYTSPSPRDLSTSRMPSSA